MVIGLVSGLTGTGKTSQVMGVAKAEKGTVVWGALDPKDEAVIMEEATMFFKPTVLSHMHGNGTPNQWMDDARKTLAETRKWADEIFKMRPLPGLVVLDGISILKDLAKDLWLEDDNLERVEANKAPRESLGENNFGALAAINDMVRAILKPILNMAVSAHMGLFFISDTKDKYLDGDVIGTTPEVIPRLTSSMPCLFELSYVDEKYNLNCVKDPFNPRWTVTGLERHIGLLNSMDDYNLVGHETSEFVIEYTEKGKTKHEFVVGIDQVSVELDFKEKHKNASEVKVSQ